MSSPFDRWRVGWAGPDRASPHILCTLATQHGGGGEVLYVDLGWVRDTERKKAEWKWLLKSIFRELDAR
jgi:hypothetical protein